MAVIRPFFEKIAQLWKAKKIKNESTWWAEKMHYSIESDQSQDAQNEKMGLKSGKRFLS